MPRWPVAALRNTEPFHAEALQRCMPLFAGRDEIVVPAIFDVEVASALLRRGTAPATVRDPTVGARPSGSNVSPAS